MLRKLKSGKIRVRNGQTDIQAKSFVKINGRYICAYVWKNLIHLYRG